MKQLWNQSVARESLLGHQTRTMNPSIAARSLLGRRVTEGAFRRLRGRRRFYRENPAPALVAAIAGKIGGRLFKVPSEQKAAKVAGAAVSSAVNGNLTAAKMIFDRQTIGIAKERAIWVAAWGQVPKSIKDAVKKYSEIIPGVDQSRPELAVQSALARAVDLNDIKQQEREQLEAVKAERRGAAASAAAASERREARFTELGAAGLQALARGGRRRGTRRRRRRSFDY